MLDRPRLGRSLETVAYLSRNWKFESISLQRRVSCEPEYLDQGRSGPSDIGAEKAARLDPGRMAPGLAGLRVGAF
jgi:hypothetical protein